MKNRVKSSFKWGGEPITHYREIETQYAVFDTKGRIVGHTRGVMRLPYTEAQWARYVQKVALDVESGYTEA